MKAFSKAASLFSIFKQAVLGTEQNFTEGSINKAIVLLSIPMILEMGMESLFAIVDIYFVSKLNSTDAVAAVGTTELMLTIIYSIAMGVSTGATAMVARRIGEKEQDGAAIASVQAMYIGLFFVVLFTIAGLLFYEELLVLLGASPGMVEAGSGYTKWMLGGNITIVLIFIINGIFRGAGDAAVAMRTLVLANGLNIVLDPLFIFGWGFFPAFGIEGAAIATNIGRAIGVSYQLYFLLSTKGIVKIRREHLKIDWAIIWNLIKISAGSTGQFLIGSASWIFLGTILNRFGAAAFAGYTFAIRVIIFTILPSWGMANAAATLVGQNLGAGQPDRAEKSVWKAGHFNLVFLGVVMILFLTLSGTLISIFTSDPEVLRYGTQCLQIVALGYVFYGYGMVVAQAFNGAGDTITPTLLNFFGFWCFQIPLAYALAITLAWGPIGVYSAIPIAESAMAVAAILIFRKGRWKTVKI
jgi:putative MATE family efflux protein